MGWGVSPVDPVEFGRHSAQLDALHTRLAHVEETITSVDAKLDTVLVTLAEKRGERRVAVAVAGFMGSLVGILFGWLSR